MPDQPPVVDELSAPLGLERKPRRQRFLARVFPYVAAGLLALVPLGFFCWVVLVEDPLGGEPMVIVATSATPADTEKPGDAGAARIEAATAEKVPAQAATNEAGSQTVTIIDGMSGTRRQVTIAPADVTTPPAPAAAGSAQKGSAEPKPASEKKAEPVAQPDTRMLEPSPHGAIPKIAPDGTRPFDAYASPRPDAGRGGGPRIAIVVGRLGVSASLATEALAKLPAPVALSFTPYGADLGRWVARARREGHEVLLQAPMEPFDYPDNDPGPKALLTSLTPDQNVDRLHWSMSRFQGYLGIGNFMGARFVSNEPAMSALMREIAKRGLGYFDDGTAARGLASQIAGANNVSFARADVVIDASPTPKEIDAALARLESLARERGVAIGSASALPISINRIALWAKAAESRGIVLVPISAVASRPRSS